MKNKSVHIFIQRWYLLVAVNQFYFWEVDELI